MKLAVYPDPILRQKAKPLTEITSEVCRKAEEMMELMHEAQGIGLAAPQAGWSVRLFIIDIRGNMQKEKVFINPVIITEEGESNKEEGCLSFPGIMGKIVRSQQIRVRAYTLEGKELEFDTEGLFARAWQHELDHLNGCLFIDKMNPAGRLSLSRQLKELERTYGKTNVHV
ncbi:MAG: peptide deformylase [Candidatus Brocadiaceae bacterium]|nr:peptide deformylase [Candidatus Brocadiaceae bacterium]